jgi:hypothetical protein
MAYVYLNPRKQQLDFALQQRASLVAERESIVQRIARIDEVVAQWDTFIDAITPLVENDPGQSLQAKSLAEICRMALEAHSQWVTAQQVRGYLNQLGISLEYTNEMAVLHTTLKRVGQTGRLNGNTFYAKKGLALLPGMLPI